MDYLDAERLRRERPWTLLASVIGCFVGGVLLLVLLLCGGILGLAAVLPSPYDPVVLEGAFAFER